MTDLRDCGHHGGKISFEREGGPYPFGVDPSWRGTKTELPYLNRCEERGLGGCEESGVWGVGRMRL